MHDHISRQDLTNIQRIITHCYEARTTSDFSSVWSELSTFVDAEYTACGIIDLRSLHAKVSQSNYNPTYLVSYMAQNLETDPSLVQLRKSPDGFAITSDTTDQNPDPKRALKETAGITNCCSVAVRGGLDIALYAAFSNISHRHKLKLTSLMSLLGAPLMLSCVRCTAPWEQQELDHPIHPLSTREEEVFSWVLLGKTNWEIAQILGIAERTVRFHLESITTKYGQSRSQLSPRTRWQITQSQLLAMANG